MSSTRVKRERKVISYAENQDESDDEDDMPISKMQKKAGDDDDDDDDDEDDLPISSLKKAGGDAEDDDDDDDDDDSPISSLAKSKPKAAAKKPAAKKVAPKKAPAKKAAAKKTAARKPASKKVEEQEVRKGGTKTETEGLYDTAKGKIIQQLLVRWDRSTDWQWPSLDQIEDDKDKHLQLDGFPGVFICVKGGSIGKLIDERPREAIPSFDALCSRPYCELIGMLRSALDKELAELEDLEKTEGFDATNVKHKLRKTTLISLVKNYARKAKQTDASEIAAGKKFDNQFEKERKALS